MGNPYAPATISNYNSSPPPDDGSQTSANEVTWSGIKTKLADSVKTLAETINANTLAAFAETFGGDISAISTDYTVVASDQGKMLACTGTHTISLPAAATIGKPFCVVIKNIGTGVITIDPNGAELVDGVATRALAAGAWAVVMTDGSAWRTANNLGAARAWVNFVGATGVINASYNVTSVTRNSAGNYTIVFTNGLGDGLYGSSVTVQEASGIGFQCVASPVSAGCLVLTFDRTGTSNDPTSVYAVFFR